LAATLNKDVFIHSFIQMQTEIQTARDRYRL